MSKKHKHRHTSTFSPADLRPRIDRARHEGRFQQALELTKQSHKYEPMPANLDLPRVPAGQEESFKRFQSHSAVQASMSGSLPQASSTSKR